MDKFSHLNSLESIKFNLEQWLKAATTAAQKEHYNFRISMIEKEIRGERKFLGLGDVIEENLSDEDLLNSLLD